MSKSPYDEGMEAGRDGRPPSACPYEDDSDEEEEWMRGRKEGILGKYGESLLRRFRRRN